MTGGPFGFGFLPDLGLGGAGGPRKAQGGMTDKKRVLNAIRALARESRDGTGTVRFEDISQRVPIGGGPLDDALNALLAEGVITEIRLGTFELTTRGLRMGRTADQVAFTPAELQAWQDLEAFVGGELHAPRLEGARAAWRVIGAWLDRVERET